jgi:leader peptidase (prepilin peptidase)/N-methyltransferase
VSARRLVTVAAVTAVLTACATGGEPLVAWWLFACGGAVLCVLDAERHLLPARIVYPLAAVIFAALAATAAVTGEPDRLLRAVLAAAVVGAGWFAVAFLAPSAMGLGDVRVAALAAGLLGWTSWSAVVTGQIATWGLAVVTAGILAVNGPRERGRGMQVPIGPALIVGAVLAGWL